MITTRVFLDRLTSSSKSVSLSLLSFSTPISFNICLLWSFTHWSPQQGFCIQLVSSGLGHSSISHAVLKNPWVQRVFHFMAELLADPQKDVTTTKLDLRLAILKPKHKIFECLKSDDGKKLIVSGFRFTRIQETVKNARKGIVPSLDPFVWRLHWCTFSLWFIRI